MRISSLSYFTSSLSGMQDNQTQIARLGEQRGVVTNAFGNRAPSRARRSTFGVSTNGWPAAPTSSQRRSSTST